MFKRTLILPLILLFILPFKSRAQDIGVLLNDALQLESRFNDQQALQKYSQVLRYQPNNLIALCKSSELHALLGRRLPTKEKQAEYYRTARAHAQRALR